MSVKLNFLAFLNVVIWLGIFSFLHILSEKLNMSQTFIELNLLKNVISICIVYEVIIAFKSLDKQFEIREVNIYFNFILGLVVFGSFFYFLLDSIDLLVYYVIFELVKFSREFYVVSKINKEQLA